MLQAVWEVFVCRQKIERGNQEGTKNLGDDHNDDRDGDHADDDDDDRDDNHNDDHDDDGIC